MNMHDMTERGFARTFLASLSIAAVAALGAPASAQDGPATLERFHPFERAFDASVFIAGGEAIGVDQDALRSVPYGRTSVIAGFPLPSGMTVDLVVERIEPLTADAVLEIMVPGRGKNRRATPVDAPRPETHFFGGTVVGDESARVFLSVTDAGVFGFIFGESGRYVLSSGPYGAGMRPAIFSTSSESFAAIDWLSFDCTALARPTATKEEIEAQSSDGGAADFMMPSCRSTDVAIETDQEYLSKFSGNTAAAIGYAQTMVAAADEIYRRDTGVQVRMSYIRLWTTTDPWTTTSSSAALPEFRTNWIANQATVNRDAAHMLSGRSLGGGIAWLDAVCTDYAYAVSGNLSGFFPTPMVMNSGQNWDVMVFNHELGHNSGSIHTHERTPPVDGCGNGDCSQASTGTIMSYCHQCAGGMNNIALQFHPLSAGEIVSYMSGAACAPSVECSSNPACVLTISSSSGSFGISGGSASVNVTTIGPLCDWTPVAVPSWITVTNPGPGSGAGSFAFTVQPNNGPSRSTVLAFGDLTYILTQNGFFDCDANGVNDEQQIAANPSLDCDSDGILNSCEIAAGAADCDGNGIPDSCQVSALARAWGAGAPGSSGGLNQGQSTVPANLANVASVAAGYTHSLARRIDGTVVAWGGNGYGQSTVPAGLGACVRIAAGSQHSLAIRQNGTAVAWGSNQFGQCDVPAGIGFVSDIAGGNMHSMALKTDGTIVCWGGNATGQINVPAGLTGVIDVEAGYAHSIALRSNGTIAVWGMNVHGQCNVPADLGPVVAVAGGMMHSLALRADGTVRAWGRNDNGQCNVPAGLVGTVALAGGAQHSLASTSVSLLADCDGDGIPNACEIAAGAPDANLNGIPDSCESIAGDLDGNGLVNGADLARLLVNWGGSGAANGDLNGSGTIDGADLAILLVNWSTP